VQALACPDCGATVEDPGLCLDFYDASIGSSYGEARRHRGRRTNRQVWAALDGGLKPAAVAAKLGISVRSVFRHRHSGRIYR